MFIIFKGDFFISENKTKHCPVCGDIVTNPNKTYCDSCTYRFNTYERRALVGINKGKYTISLARKMLRLRKQGKSNVAIAKEVKLPNPYTDSGLVVPIIRFLLNDEADDVLESYNEYKINSKKQLSNSNKANKKLKICLVCGKEFLEPKTVSGQKYCPSCKSKYKDTEIRVLLGAKEGKYNAHTATEVYRLKKRGLNNKEIGEKLNIPNSLITPIIELLLPEDLSVNIGEETKPKAEKPTVRNCLICGKEFIVPKGASSKKYCDECNKKYDNSQKVVLAGINEGKFDKKLAIKLNDLINKGLSKKQASQKLKLSSPGLVNPILEYLYYDDVKPVNAAKGPINTSFINIGDLESLDLDNYLIRTDHENGSNILLKGVIPKENENALFRCLSGKGVSVKELSFKENIDGTFEVAIDLDVDKAYVDGLVFELRVIGFK